MRLPLSRVLGFTGIVLVLALVALAVYLSVGSDAEKKLEQAREQNTSSAQEATVIESGSTLARLPQGFRFLTSVSTVNDIVSDETGLWIGTNGGLLHYAPSGEELLHLTHANGLPDIRIQALLSADNTVYAATRKGLVRIRDTQVAVITPRQSAGFDITALERFEGRIAVGTRHQGVLLFDGIGFSTELMALPGADFTETTSLAAWNGSLVVGTREQGLFILRDAVFEQLTEEQQVPSNHVTGLDAGEDLLVATTTGTCSVDDRLRVLPSPQKTPTSDVVRSGSFTWTATLDGRIALLSDGRRRDAFTLGNSSWPVTVSGLKLTGERTWACTSRGLFELTTEGPRPFLQEIDDHLLDEHVAALATDAAGRLWIGSFDEGLEVRSATAEPVARFTDPNVRTVKCLWFDPAEGAIWVGSSKGLTRFNHRLERQHFTEASGLISNEVNAVARTPEGELAVGTGGGLSIMSGATVRSIYAFHGLINNKVFALEPVEAGPEGGGGSYLAVATLGGISFIDGLRVTGHITPENSDMPMHWTTALAAMPEGLFIGTYGGGLSFRSSTGQWLPMPPEVSNIEINPNAILADGQMLLAGTLDKGLALLDTEGRWRLIVRNLPSANITALAADGEHYYVGTDVGIVIASKGSLN